MGPADTDPRLRNLATRKICSSLLLQQLLYYQVFFSIAWIIFWITWLFHTYWSGLKFMDPDIGRMVTMIFWGIGEPTRLVVGWYGNMQENVPWLVLFIILSFFPTQAVIFYILLACGDIYPYHKAVQYVQAALIETEVIVGIYAAVRMYRLQRQQFYLFEFALGEARKTQKTKRLAEAASAGRATGLA